MVSGTFSVRGAPANVSKQNCFSSSESKIFKKEGKDQIFLVICVKSRSGQSYSHAGRSGQFLLSCKWVRAVFSPMQAGVGSFTLMQVGEGSQM